MKTLTQPAVRKISMQSINALAKLMGQSSVHNDQAFSLNDLTEVNKTRKNAIKTFNELSAMGAFYEIKDKTMTEKGNSFTLNPKVCAELLINSDSNTMIGKQIFEYNTPTVTLFGTVNSKQDVYESVQKMLQMVTGFNGNLDANNINVFEIIGKEPIMRSLIENDNAVIIGDEFDILDDPEVALVLEEAFMGMSEGLFNNESAMSSEKAVSKTAPIKRKAYSKQVSTLVCDKTPLYRKVEL